MLRAVPFISIGLIFFAKIVFPEITKFQPQFLIFNLLLCVVSLLAIMVLYNKKRINKRLIVLLLLGLTGTVTIFFIYYTN